MERALQPAPSAFPAALEETAAEAREYLAHAKAANTIRAYRSDWADFSGWCAERGFTSLPATPETVALYLTESARAVKTSTLQRRLSSISQAHQAAGHESPTRAYAVRMVWAGIRRTLGTAQEGVAPLVIEDLRNLVCVLPAGLAGARSRALLLLGFAGAFRRSELVSLDVEDLEWKRDGLAVTLRRSKTDQEGAGSLKGIPYGQHHATCPVRALKAWLADSGIEAGPLFRSIDRHGRMGAGRLSDKAVAGVIKRACEEAGLDPSRYSGHSLRAGLATSAGEAGVEERLIMKQTGHRSERMVRKYIRSGALFRENAAGKVGL
jgi:site-specific recombinase XerD